MQKRIQDLFIKLSHIIHFLKNYLKLLIFYSEEEKDDIDAFSFKKMVFLYFRMNTEYFFFQMIKVL